MASANHSEQKGQDGGRRGEGPRPLPTLCQPLPQGVDLGPRAGRHLQPPPSPGGQDGSPTLEAGI